MLISRLHRSNHLKERSAVALRLLLLVQNNKHLRTTDFSEDVEEFESETDIN